LWRRQKRERARPALRELKQSHILSLRNILALSHSEKINKKAACA
jgi:hypothetical protein